MVIFKLVKQIMFGKSTLMMCLLPESNTIKNNLFMNNAESNIDVIHPDTDAATSFLQFTPNKFEGNIVSGGKVLGIDKNEGITQKDVKGATDKNGIFTAKDLKGIGADEYVTNTAECHPLQPNEVGPSWMKF